MDTAPMEMAIPRRTLLVVAGASGVLVACGGSSDDPGPSASPSSAGGGSGEVVAAVADVAVGGGAINRNVHIVVTQPTEGQFKAFASVCTHQGCDVGSVSNNVIVCGCHGSKFSAETGEVEVGPAKAPLAEVAVVVQGDNIVRA